MERGSESISKCEVEFGCYVVWRQQSLDDIRDGFGSYIFSKFRKRIFIIRMVVYLIK